MLIGIGGTYAVETFTVYLLAHACYKGALFMGVGAVDHETGTRDVTQLGGLLRLMPVSAAAIGLAALSNAGLPPFLGFIGKEFMYSSTVGMSDAGMACAGLAGDARHGRRQCPDDRDGGAGVREAVPGTRTEAADGNAHEAPVSLWLGPSCWRASAWGWASSTARWSAGSWRPSPPRSRARRWTSMSISGAASRCRWP